MASNSQTIKSPPSLKKIKTTSLYIGLVVFVVSCLLYLLRPQILTDIEGRLLDARFKLRGPIEVSGLVNIVAVDEDSIEAIGRWPWSREKIAELIEKINAAGAITTALDIVFSEPQADIATQLAAAEGLDESERERLLRVLKAQSPDQVLARAISRSSNVVNGHFFYLSKSSLQGLRTLQQSEEQKLLASSTVTAVRAKTDNFPSVEAVAVRQNIPLISRAGQGSGYFNFIPGSDGLIRSAPLVMRYKESFYPSLALKALTHYLGGVPIVIYAEDYGIAKLSLGGLEVPTNELGAIMLNYRGPAKTIETISALDVLKGNIPPSQFADKMVLLGVTAIGVYDAHSTPYGPSFPGLEIQANVAENIIQGDYIIHSAMEELVDLLTMAAMVLLVSLFISRMKRAYPRLIFTLLLVAIYTSVNYQLFAQMNLWLNLVYPLLAALLTYITLTVYLTLSVEQRYSMVRSVFKYYLNPELVDQLTRKPELLQFGGENKVLSILFSDIRNFTNLSESLTPQQLAQFMQCYMDPMTEMVLDNNGTLDKYIGDAVMAIFGAPVPSQLHPHDACEAALSMISALDGIQGSCPELEHVFPVRCGVGIHTGEVVVGNLGSSFHFTYTVLGDNVNLASRLEGLTKMYGVDILISESTYQQVKDDYVCRDLDLVRVKGKKIPIWIHELCGRNGEVEDMRFIEQWQVALADYHEQKWEKALAQFEMLAARAGGDVASELYVERCKAYLRNPPPKEWDGVTVMTTK